MRDPLGRNWSRENESPPSFVQEIKGPSFSLVSTSLKTNASEALVWLLSALLLAPFLWVGSYLGAALILHPITAIRDLAMAPLAIPYFALIALVTSIPIVVCMFPVLLAWRRYTNHIRLWESSRSGVLLGSLVLAIPPALVVILSFVGYPGPFVDWETGIEVAPFVLLTVWGALSLPRLLFPRVGKLLGAHHAER